MRRGFYIVYEGVVACGKTTQSKKTYEWLTSIYPSTQVIWTREPGGSEIADEIRGVVQATPFKEEMDPVCEAYLYASSRAQTLRTIVQPVLENNGIVVADRSFITSLAFQGYGRDLGIDAVLKINEYAIQGFIPDLVVYVKLDPEIALARVLDKDGDKFEHLGLDFFSKAEEGFNEISQLQMFEGRWLTIDGFGTVEEVTERISNEIRPYLDNFNA